MIGLKRLLSGVAEGRGRPAADVKVRKARERAAAVAVSIAVHIVILFAVFATASGVAPKGVSDPFGEGEAISVSLSGLEGGAGRRGQEVAINSEEPSALDQMARRVETKPAALPLKQAEPIRQRQGLSQIFDSIGRLGGPGRQGEGTERSGQGVRGRRDAVTATASRAGAEGQEPGSQGLWGQIEPCWRRLPNRVSVGVTLEITLDGRGRLAAPPRILRPPGVQLSEQRLLAEAQAIGTLQACLPYTTSGVNGLKRAYRLRFGAD